MKELSIEEKAKRYDKALEKAKNYHSPETVCNVRIAMENLFPELAEPEDEKIRKELIGFIKGCGAYSQEYIDWLEKQGEISPSEDELEALRIAAYEPYKNWSEKLQSLYMKLSHCEQGEQKSADEVNPKFKVGDWVVNTITDNVEQIIEVTSNEYVCSGILIVSFDNQHLLKKWAINDAKDGDVLNSVRVEATIIFKGWNPDGKHLDAYCALQKGILIKQEMLWDRDFEPATQEQRNLLFQKMKEAGYKWDADKKELKKITTPIFNIGDTIVKKHNSDIHDFGLFTITDITGGKYWYNDRIICDITEQNKWELYKPTKQNSSVWSEEDEKVIHLACEFIRHRTNEFNNGGSIGGMDYKTLYNKLKSLRSQNQKQWKPDSSMLICLEYAIKHINKDGDKKILSKLLEQLKKLREK